VKQLLEAGADVNTQAGMFGTALQAASYRGDRDVVKQLLEAGADVNTRQKVGKYGSALEAALNRNKDDVVRLLLQASADVNELDTEQDLKLQKILKEENGIENFGLRRETV
jgi:ankyrin repeat protein